MDTFNNVWTKIGGRKLIAYFLGLTALVVLAFQGHLNETAMWGILGLSATFAGGNIGEHISGALKARAASVLGVDSKATEVVADPADNEKE